MSRDVIQMRRWVATSVLIVALFAGGFLGTWAVRWAGHEVFGAANVPLKEAGDVNPVSLGRFSDGFAAVLKPVLPTVVSISTTKVIKVQQNVPGFFNDPFFRQFFGNQFSGPATQKEHFLGSGVIVNPDGYILTNNHVVANASDVEVVTRDKKNYKAKIVGRDAATDIAVLKIEATDLPIITIGDSSKLQVGDVVFAIGDPFGIGETATMGIVSATGRSLANTQIGQIERYEDFIQSDAAINPGNSGGAMVDVRGNLVGINTAIIPGQTQMGEGGNIGIGFAVPVNLAKHVMQQIIEHGKVERGYMGLLPEDLDPQMAKQFGRNEGGGVLVSQVSAGTPAAKAGLKVGDIILQVNGQDLSGAEDLRTRIASFEPGTSIQLKVWRDGKTLEVPLTLEAQPPDVAGNESISPESPSQGNSKAMEGVQVENLNSDILGQLNLPPSTHGVVVDSVDQSSPAGEYLQQGDVIQEVNHKKVDNVAQYRAALAGTGDNPVLLLVERGGQTGSITTYILIQP